LQAAVPREPQAFSLAVQLGVATPECLTAQAHRQPPVFALRVVRSTVHVLYRYFGCVLL